MAITSSKNSNIPLFAETPAQICVIGVGGGGCNAIVRMLKAKPVPGVRYLGVNTDIKSLQQMDRAQVIQIGEGLTNGMGAGGDPERGAEAAEKSRKVLKQALNGMDLVFLAVGMGGGTGTGAAPVVAEVAKEVGALVVAVVTTPFSFEGLRRHQLAQDGVYSLQDRVDNTIVIHNDRLINLLDDDVSMAEALRRADEAVTLGVHSVAELVNLAGEINVDMADVKSIMKLPGMALMAIGEGYGAGGALQGARLAVSNPLLDVAIDGAKGVLFNVSGGPRLKLSEVNETGEYIRSLVDPNATIFFGMVNDRALKEKTRITLIATGIPSASERVESWEESLSTLLAGSGTRATVDDLDLPPFLRNRRSFGLGR